MKKADLKTLGNNIRAERNRLKYTQEDIEQRTGILAQHIGRIEKGEVDVRFSTLILILEALNITFDKIYKLNIKK